MREGKKTFEVWFWRVDPRTACFDGDSALAQFVQTKEEVAL